MLLLLPAVAVAVPAALVAVVAAAVAASAASLGLVLVFAFVLGAVSCGGKYFLVQIILQRCLTSLPNSSPLNALPVQLSSRFVESFAWI